MNKFIAALIILVIQQASADVPPFTTTVQVFNPTQFCEVINFNTPLLQEAGLSDLKIQCEAFGKDGGFTKKNAVVTISGNSLQVMQNCRKTSFHQVVKLKGHLDGGQFSVKEFVGFLRAIRIKVFSYSSSNNDNSSINDSDYLIVAGIPVCS